MAEFAVRRYCAVVFELDLRSSSCTGFTFAILQVIGGKFSDGTWMIAGVVSKG